MKHVLSGLVCGLLAVVSPVRAAQAGVPSKQAASGQAAVDGAIAKEQGAVSKLRGDVGREEDRSHRASVKLRQQDQAIAELQRQLDALKKAPQGGGHS